MIRRRAPLKRSTKPLKRSPIRRSTKPIERRRKVRPDDDPTHLDAVRSAGCVVCWDFFHRYRIAEAHHVRDGYGLAQRAPDSEACGLCSEHHRTGAFGEAIHNGAETFQERYGTERELLARTLQLLGSGR